VANARIQAVSNYGGAGHHKPDCCVRMDCVEALPLMKTSRHRGNRGAVLLVIIVLIFMLLFLGYTLWEIWKMMRKIPTAPANQADVISGEMLNEFQLAHPNENITSISTQYVTMTVVQPFDATNLSMRVWRSTNLIDWQLIATNMPGEFWQDTNAPWPAGFYKQEPIIPQ